MQEHHNQDKQRAVSEAETIFRDAVTAENLSKFRSEIARCYITVTTALGIVGISKDSVKSTPYEFQKIEGKFIFSFPATTPGAIQIRWVREIGRDTLTSSYHVFQDGSGSYNHRELYNPEGYAKHIVGIKTTEQACIDGDYTNNPDLLVAKINDITKLLLEATCNTPAGKVFKKPNRLGILTRLFR